MAKSAPPPPPRPAAGGSGSKPPTTTKTRASAPPPPPPPGKVTPPSKFQSNGLDNRMKVDNQGRVSANYAEIGKQRKQNRAMAESDLRLGAKDAPARARAREAATQLPPPPPRGAVSDNPSGKRKFNPGLFTAKGAEKANRGLLRPASKNDNNPVKPAPPRLPDLKKTAPPPPPSKFEGNANPTKKGMFGRKKG